MNMEYTKKASDEEEQCDGCTMVQPVVPDIVDQWVFGTRQVVIVGEITTQMAVAIVHRLAIYDALSPTKPIIIGVMSPGGATDAGYTVIDRMQMCNAPVWTINLGVAYSMAAEICAFGTLGYRFAYPSASYMMHPATFQLGTGIEIPTIPGLSDFLARNEITTIKRLATYIGVKSEKLLSDVRNTKWMTFKEAKRMKIVDKVWTPELEHGLKLDTEGTQDGTK